MKSIRWKITLSYLGLAAITLVITGVLLLVTTRILSRQVQETELRETALELLPEIQTILRSEDDPERARELIGALESVANIELRFVGPDGVVDTARLFLDGSERKSVGTPGPNGHRMPPDPELARVMDWVMRNDPRLSTRREPRRLPPGIVRLGTDSATSYLEVRDKGGVQSQFTRIAGLGFLIAAALTLAASAGIGAMVSRNLTRPILALTAAAVRMQRGDLDARAPVTTHDEIGTLSSQFNSMASALSASIRGLRRERDSLRSFLADASHELRTPLTAMTTLVEVLQNGPHDSAMTDDIHDQLERMKHTVENLLNLSRLDGGVTALNREAIPIEAVLNNAWAAALSGAPSPDSRMTVAFESRPHPSVLGDRNQLQVLFENLFANSLQAAAGAVNVECIVTEVAGPSEDARLCMVSVTDDGPGIDPEYLPHVFERFYRGERHAPDGSGLGLAIARAIVEAHGGEITIESPPRGRERGVRILLRLPFGVH